jgi:YidC/Oxa1 family membrane protein insertase
MINLLTQIFYVPFLNLLTFIIWSTPGHYAAVGIIVLTLLVRVSLISPSRKAAQAQRKMAQLQPLLNDLKVEYADDKQGLATAQMELYKKNNISPFSSCGQSIIQLVVLVILYHAIRDGLVIHNPNIYSWMPKLDSVNNMFFGIDLLKPDKYLILPILASIVQFAQIYLTMPHTKKVPGVAVDPTQAMTQNTLYITSLFPILIGRTLPAAIALYWVVGTLFMVVQQYIVNKDKFELAGVKEVMKEADKEHPGYHRSKASEKEIMEETSVKKGVSVTVRRKK